MGKDLERILNMMKLHPEGIPLKKLSVAYGQEYRQNLTLASLGFKSMADLVASLDEELVVEKEHVYHKIHRPHGRARASALATGDSRPASPSRATTRSGKDPPQAPSASNPSQAVASSHYGLHPSVGISFGAPMDSAVPSSSTTTTTSPAPLLPLSSTSKKTSEKQTQDQLLQRVREVSKCLELKNSFLSLLD